MRRLASTLLIGAALVLGACGSDNNDNASTTTGTTQSTTTQSTTGTSGSTGTKKQKKSSGSKNKSGGSSTSGGGSTQTGTQTQTQAPAQTQSTTTPSPSSVTPFKTAKTVCGTFLPKTIQRQIKNGKTTKKKVAKQYSKGFAQDQRSQAYKGCLAGLK
jgi:hypothetical protein